MLGIHNAVAEGVFKIFGLLIGSGLIIGLFIGWLIWG